MGMIKNEVDYVIELWVDPRIYSRECSALLSGSGLSTTEPTEHYSCCSLVLTDRPLSTPEFYRVTRSYTRAPRRYTLYFPPAKEPLSRDTTQWSDS